MIQISAEVCCRPSQTLALQTSNELSTAWEKLSRAHFHSRRDGTDKKISVDPLLPRWVASPPMESAGRWIVRDPEIDARVSCIMHRSFFPPAVPRHATINYIPLNSSESDNGDKRVSVPDDSRHSMSRRSFQKFFCARRVASRRQWTSAITPMTLLTP